MLVKFYQAYYRYLKNLENYPIDVVKKGHVYFDIQLAKIDEKYHAGLDTKDVAQFEQHDFTPIYKDCKYTYDWYQRTYSHYIFIQKESIRDPESKGQFPPNIDNVSYNSCLLMIHYQAYKLAHAKDLLPHFYDKETHEKAKRTVADLEERHPNKDIYSIIENYYQNEVKQNNKEFQVLRKRNFLD